MMSFNFTLENKMTGTTLRRLISYMKYDIKGLLQLIILSLNVFIRPVGSFFL